jgi:hypothetical protein
MSSELRWGDLLVAGNDRRSALRARHRNGVDTVEVTQRGHRLAVTFLERVPRGLNRANVRVDGPAGSLPVTVRALINPTTADPEREDRLIVELDRRGSPGTYRLSLVERRHDGLPGNQPLHGIDPRFATVDFAFDIGDPNPILGVAPPGSPPALLEDISYLGRDYEGLRQLILDRMSVTIPAWTERHIPDIGITLAELFAYVGDDLSYYQDAVATEAYMQTARRRISVRRHARLVDYRMHDGCNARAWVSLEVAGVVELELDDIGFAASAAGPVSGQAAIDLALLAPTVRDALTHYTPLAGPAAAARRFALKPAHNKIRLWSWGEHTSALAAGATSAVLVDGAPRREAEGAPRGEAGDAPRGKAGDAPRGKAEGAPRGEAEGAPRGEAGRTLTLSAGDVLLLEETTDPAAPGLAPADPDHRQAVRLVSVRQLVDELYAQPLLEVTWAAEDALAFELPVRSGGVACSCARGNTMLVGHGLRTSETIDLTRPQLGQAGLTFSTPFPDPSLVARHQAHTLRRLDAELRAQLEAARIAARRGRPISKAFLRDLRALFGSALLDELDLGAEAEVVVVEDEVAVLVVEDEDGVEDRVEVEVEVEIEDRVEDRVEAEIEDRVEVEVEDGVEIEDRVEVEVELDDRVGVEVELDWAESETARAERQARGLGQILLAADRLLAGRRRRAEALASMAEMAGPLDPLLLAELVDDWGHELTATLDPGRPACFGPAAGALTQDPRRALAQLRLADASSSPAQTWDAASDLLDASADQLLVLPEVDDGGVAHLRLSAQPESATALTATYLAGNGTAGNLLAGAISAIYSVAGGSRTAALAPIEVVRNPLPAGGGIDAEDPAAVKLAVAGAYLESQQRALTAADYARLAESLPGVRRAAAELRWTGAETVVEVAVQPVVGEDPQPTLLDDVARSLAASRRIGHVLIVRAPRYRPVVVAVEVTLDDETVRAEAAATLAAVLSSGWLADGTPGALNPANVGFGQPVHASRIVAAVHALDGVDDVALTRFSFADGPPHVVADTLSPAALEIVRLDNDPRTPSNGYAIVALVGGR